MLFPVLTESRCVIDLSGTWNFKADACAWDLRDVVCLQAQRRPDNACTGRLQ